MEKRKSIHIGTSGWHYQHWKKNFYPAGLQSGRFFQYFLRNFDTVEINNSFYRLPKKDVLESWHDKTPPGFIFSVKASRYITHIKKLKDPQKTTLKFFKAIKNLKPKLGPVLFQLAPAHRPNPERLESFLEVLPRDYRYTFEFRNHGWFNKQIYRILRKYNAAFCIYDLAGKLSSKEATADFIYIRLHGPGRAYEGSYSKKVLRNWAEDFRSWRKGRKEVFCYFDNDQAGYAAKNALELKEILG